VAVGEEKMDHLTNIFLAKDEENIKSYFQSLLSSDGEGFPDVLYYLDYEDPFILTIGKEMYAKCKSEGIRGLKAYLASLRWIKDPKYQRLRQVLLDGSVELDWNAGTLLSDVTPQKIPWLWYPRLAQGKLTTLDGDPALGKSSILDDLAARTTTGRDMPDGRPCLTPGGVVIIAPEDGLEDTIQPRLARAGADLSKVIDLSMVKVNEREEVRQPFRLQYDLDYLEAAIRLVDATLVYIDPIMALVDGSANMNSDDDVRRFLSPLRMLVERNNVACIIVRHMTKTRGQNPLMAGSGSIGIIGLARHGLMVVENPKDKSQVILSHIKNNIGPRAPDLTYTICSDEASGDDRPYVVWGNETKSSASDSSSA
jgi:hypothetical protein